MIKDKVLDKLAVEAVSVSADRSRCLRMRFNRNECSECTSLCPSGAISIQQDVSIDSRLCSECMLCVSACPSDTFGISGLDFYSLVGRLRKIRSSVPSPVLGCSARSNDACHVKTFCFGYLSEEHLIALSVLMQDPFQVDMTGCSDCGNGFIVGAVEKRITGIEEKTTLKISKKLQLVKCRADLDFREVSYDRRGFFTALRNMTFVQAAGLLGNEEEREDFRSYSAKKLPFNRELLNRALKVLAEEGQQEILKNYYYTANVTDTCDNCFACVGMCPSGALKTGVAEGGSELIFNSSLCSGCGLCGSFCMKKSLKIEKGFSGHNPFEFACAKMVQCAE